MRTRFITSAAARGGFPPPDHPEVAFAGKSNVGKSSLLNTLANAKLARVSKTPGRTQLINFFEVQNKEQTWGLADLPGYGYAKVPTRVTKSWAPLIESYLEHRDCLKQVYVLVDVRRGLQEVDAELLAYLAEVNTAATVVATKLDKLKKAQKKPALHAIAKDVGCDKHAVVGTSALNREGIERLAALVEAHLFGA